MQATIYVHYLYPECRVFTVKADISSCRSGLKFARVHHSCLTAPDQFSLSLSEAEQHARAALDREIWVTEKRIERCNTMQGDVQAGVEDAIFDSATPSPLFGRSGQLVYVHNLFPECKVFAMYAEIARRRGNQTATTLDGRTYNIPDQCCPSKQQAARWAAAGLLRSKKMSETYLEQLLDLKKDVENGKAGAILDEEMSDNLKPYLVSPAAGSYSTAPGGDSYKP